MQRFIKQRSAWLLLGLVLCGAWLRFSHFGLVPPGLTTDEAAITYDAWGISIDGMDQWGHHLPLMFTSLGDGKLPLTHYALALCFKLMGFSVYGIRVLTAVFGTMLIVGTFLLGKELFNDRRIGLIAATLVCFSPWSIHFSRFGLEAGVSVALATFGLYGLVKRSWWGIILLATCIYTYHSSLVVIPILLLTYLFTQPSLSLKKKTVFLVFFTVLITPLLVAEAGSGWERARQTVRIPSSLSSVLSSSIEQLSPSFWIWGKQPNLRQAVPGSFILLIPEIIFLIMGLLKLKMQRKFVWIWLVIGFVPSLIGTPSPHTIRAYHLVPLLFYIEAQGILWIYQRWKGLLVLAVIGYMICWGRFWFYYTTVYITDSARDFGYGYRQLFQNLKQKSTLQSTFVVSPFMEQPYIYTLLFWKISPPEFRAGGLANMTYRPIQWPEQLQSDRLYAGSSLEIPPNDPRVITIIPYPHTQTPLWVIAR